MKTFKRLVLAAILAAAGGVGVGAAPAKASCIETPIDDAGCLWVCPRVGKIGGTCPM